jgi:hypothetical protein
MNDQTYNGWTNRETWLVNLWMDNEQGSQEYWRERAQECYSRAPYADDQIENEWAAIVVLAEELEQSHDEMIEQSNLDTSGVLIDFVNQCMGQVNWREIAEHYIHEFSRD